MPKKWPKNQPDLVLRFELQSTLCKQLPKWVWCRVLDAQRFVKRVHALLIYCYSIAMYYSQKAVWVMMLSCIANFLLPPFQKKCRYPVQDSTWVYLTHKYQVTYQMKSNQKILKIWLKDLTLRIIFCWKYRVFCFIKSWLFLIAMQVANLAPLLSLFLVGKREAKLSILISMKHSQVQNTTVTNKKEACHFGVFECRNLEKRRKFLNQQDTKLFLLF